MATSIINPININNNNKNQSTINPTNMINTNEQTIIDPKIKNNNKKVTSVNGKVGDVYINAHDVGTYSGKEIEDRISQIDPGVFAVKSIMVNGENFPPNKRGVVDLPDYPNEPTALSELSEDETHLVVSNSEKELWNNKSDFSGDYDDLENKPTIPTVEYATSSDMNDIHNMLIK